MPLITVIIPLYNKKNYISRTIESIRKQTYRDYEIIVVDDGSTDGGEQIVKKIQNPQLKLISQENSGPGCALNVGLHRSQTKYVTFLDADDEMLPEYLSKGIENLEQHPSCGISNCSVLKGPEKKITTNPTMLKINGGEWRLPHNASPELVAAAVMDIHMSFVAKKYILESLGGFYENKCVFGEDVYLYIQILLNYPIYREKTPLLWYHTENAELNLHYQNIDRHQWREKRKARPLLPTMTDPNRIRSNCPSIYKSLLEKYLAREAMNEALTRVSVGDVEVAKILRNKFPLMRKMRWKYIKLFMRMLINM